MTEYLACSLLEELQKAVQSQVPDVCPAAQTNLVTAAKAKLNPGEYKEYVLALTTAGRLRLWIWAGVELY